MFVSDSDHGHSVLLTSTMTGFISFQFQVTKLAGFAFPRPGRYRGSGMALVLVNVPHQVSGERRFHVCDVCSVGTSC